MRTMKNQQGSTSVLIILLMIVLMAFGVAALTTAYAGLRLTQRNSVFVQDDYELEGKAVAIQYDLLTLLDEHRLETLNAVGAEDPMFYDYLYSEILNDIYTYAEKSSQLEMVGFEEDLFLSNLSGGERIGTFHYQVASDVKEDKLFKVELDVHLPDADGNLGLGDLLVVNRWQLSTGSVGEVDEDIFFEDPFGNPFEDEDDFFEEDMEDNLDEDNDPFN